MALERRVLKSIKNFKKVSGETKKVLDKAKPLSYNNKAAHPIEWTNDLKRTPEKFQKNLKKVLDKPKQL